MLSAGRPSASAILRSEQAQCVRFEADNSLLRSIAAIASANEGSSSPISLIGITSLMSRDGLGWPCMYYIVYWDNVAS